MDKEFMFAEEDISTKNKKVILDVRENIDKVDELISIINPKLKRSLDASKDQIRNNRRQPCRE